MQYVQIILHIIFYTHIIWTLESAVYLNKCIVQHYREYEIKKCIYYIEIYRKPKTIKKQYEIVKMYLLINVFKRTDFFFFFLNKVISRFLPMIMPDV